MIKNKLIKTLTNLILLVAIIQYVSAHGEGGSIEKIIDNYKIDLRFSEDPLNDYESIFFIITLRSPTEPVDFESIQLKMTDDKKTLVSTSLSPEFKGQSGFVFKFPSVGNYIIETKFSNGLQTIVQTEFNLGVVGEEGTKIASKAEDNFVEVLIDDGGFTPKVITISKGTKVTWRNTGNNFHWPASDFHPLHTLYPTEEKGCLGSNFDACEGLAAGKTYSFTFDQIGSWTAHDHLYPGLTMQINVIKAESRIKSILSKITSYIIGSDKETQNTVENIPPSEFLQLPVPDQRNYMEKLSAENSEAAWKYLKDTFIVDNQVIGNAHELGHIVGNAINDEYGISGILRCDPAFGFACFHGVTEKLLSESGRSSIKEIESKCVETFPDRRRQEIPSCIHGIGHGLLTLNNLNINNALSDCDQLLEHNRLYCYDGVFMENLISSPAIDIDPDNPWDFCTNFDEKYHASCANYHAAQLLSNFNFDVAELSEVCEASSSSTLKFHCIRSLGLRVGQISQGNPTQIQNLCLSIKNTESRNNCLIYAAVETIFQEFTGWQSTYRSICNSLQGDAADSCNTQTKQVIIAYNRDDSVPATQPIPTIIQTTNPSTEILVESPEIREIKRLGGTYASSETYRKLMDRVGPVQAQEELYRSGLPFTGETHLLNHASGEYLYENFGPAGLVQCKDYFLSSCYHGFTIELIGEEGLLGVNEVIKECQNIGITTLSQCIHSMGHGFVSWVGYKQLPQALELCDEVVSNFPNAPVFNCYDGVFMENVWGIHDGYPSPDRWIDDNDPLYPCYDSRIDPKYRLGCLANTATLMLKTFNGNLTKSGELCLSIRDSIEREGCFDNLARQIHPMTFGHVDKVYELCNTMPEDWKNFCIIRVATSDMSVGGRELAFEICNRIDESNLGLCYDSILNTLSVYTTNPLEFHELCKKVEDPYWREQCLSRANNINSR